MKKEMLNSITMKKKIGWVKVNYEYSRGDFEFGRHRGIVAYGVEFNELEKVVRNYFLAWSGKGKIKILDIETGLFGEDQLNKKAKKRFRGMIVKFNNP